VIGHAFAQPGKLTNPGEPVRDADNTTDLPGQPAEVDAAADIWQLETAEVDANSTVLADWAGIFPPETPITAASSWRETATDRLFRVHGQPESRSSLLTGLPDHVEARLKFISDQQGAPS
jgi:hypothetical protein